jgi:hypothetical protein
MAGASQAAWPAHAERPIDEASLAPQESKPPLPMEGPLILLEQLGWLYGSAGGGANLGRRLRQAQERLEDAAELRFFRLLSADRAQLLACLPGVLAWLQRQGLAVDMAVLQAHLAAWEQPGGAVQRAWAQAFWQPAAPATAHPAENHPPQQEHTHDDQN